MLAAEVREIQRRLELIEVLAERINLGVDILVDAYTENAKVNGTFAQEKSDSNV